MKKSSDYEIIRIQEVYDGAINGIVYQVEIETRKKPKFILGECIIVQK